MLGRHKWIFHTQYRLQERRRDFWMFLRVTHWCNSSRSQITVRLTGERIVSGLCEGLGFFHKWSVFLVLHFFFFCYKQLSLFIDFLIRPKRFSCSLEREENVGVFLVGQNFKPECLSLSPGLDVNTVTLYLPPPASSLPLSLWVYQLHIYCIFSYKLQ